MHQARANNFLPNNCRLYGVGLMKSAVLGHLWVAFFQSKAITLPEKLVVFGFNF